jgi:formylmethanofuran dehydrogenase subunit C
MTTITLKLREPPTVPLEAESINPDFFASMSGEQIRASLVYHGKRQCRLDDFFDIEGEYSDTIQLHGDLRHVKMIGKSMSQGSITVHGSVGMHLGAQMKGGSIEVTGDAGDWVGAEMLDGSIRIHGNAGGQIGAAYRGSMQGMKNGTIVVAGTAGIEVGMRMRRGTIVVGGKVRDFCGLQMKGGTIILQDGAEIRTGAWMVRGTIMSLQPVKLMPTFMPSGSFTPTFLNVCNQHLRHFGVSVPNDPTQGSWSRYVGDTSVPGKGEVLIWTPA